MSQDVLSQKEIDALLSAISTGVVSADEIKSEEKNKHNKIKTYDFKRPDKFSKEQIRTLYMLHESFSRTFNTYLSGQLRTYVHIDVGSVEQVPYEEFVGSIANPSVMGIFTLAPLEGSFVIEISPNTVFAIIDRFLGGPGLAPKEIRPLTDIEQVIVKKIMNKALEHWTNSWEQVEAFQTKLVGVESNPQFVQILPPNEMVVIITLQIKVGDIGGFIKICLPYISLEPIMPKLSRTLWMSNTSRQVDQEKYHLIQKQVGKSSVAVAVELGKLALSVREILGLERGDVLKLDTNMNSGLSFLIGSREKFKCKPGVCGKHLGVEITSVVNDD